MWMLAVTSILGCGQGARVDALQAELAQTRKELKLLRDEVRKGTPAVSRPAAEKDAEPKAASTGGVDPVERARRRAVDDDIVEVNSIADAVDQDLGLLEDDVDDQAALLDEVQEAVDDLTEIVNNHADLLDQISEDILGLDQDTQLVRDLQGTLVVDDGRIRIVDADLVLVQGTDANGRPKTNGQILTQPAALRKDRAR